MFEKLASEDIEYMDSEQEFDEIPKFGNARSSFEDVVEFYGYWESYATKKTYVWLFTHDISEIRDRRVLKHLGKEHKKIQQKARKERNEEIRSLVLFVKKRDKRMAEYKKLLEEKAQQNRLKSEQNKLEQIRKRNEELKEQQQNSKVSSEMQEQIKKLEESYFNQYTDSEESEEEDDETDENVTDELGLNVDPATLNEIDDLYCVACNKFFNSESSKKNHDASKKHKTNIELLRKQMEKDEFDFQKSDNSSKDSIEEEEEMEEMSSEDSEAETANKKTKVKKSKKKKRFEFEEPEETNEVVTNDDDDIVDLLKSTNISESPIENDDSWSNSKKAKKTKSKNKTKPNENDKKVNETQTSTETQLNSAQISEKTKIPVAASDELTTEADHRCATCGQIFPSKNKMFDHLKKTNHGVYLGDHKPKMSEKPSRKKKK